MASSLHAGNKNDNAETKEKIRRITSNLPEVYNKYFFTMQNADSVEKKRIGKDPMAETSPTQIGVNKGFSLTKT